MRNSTTPFCSVHFLSLRPLAAAVSISFIFSALSAPDAAGYSCVHPASNAYIQVPGDVNGSGAVNVADAVCATLLGLWQIEGSQPPSPGCAGGLPWRGDLNCDGSYTVADAQNIVRLALGMPLDGAIDSLGRGCGDACIPNCGAAAGQFCFIEGVCALAQAPDPSGSCAWCAPGVHLEAWTPEESVCADPMIQRYLTIFNPAPVDLEMFQVLADVSAFVDEAGEAFEVRDGDVLLPYCFVQPNGECAALPPAAGASEIWLRVPLLQAAKARTLVIAQVAHMGGVAGEQVFDLYDDFNAGLNAGLWDAVSTGGTPVVSGGVLAPSGTGGSNQVVGLRAKAFGLSADFELRGRVSVSTSGGIDSDASLLMVPPAWSSHASPPYLTSVNGYICHDEIPGHWVIGNGYTQFSNAPSRGQGAFDVQVEISSDLGVRACEGLTGECSEHRVRVATATLPFVGAHAFEGVPFSWDWVRAQRLAPDPVDADVASAPPSCAAWAQLGATEPGEYIVDFDGSGEEEPQTVVCEFGGGECTEDCEPALPSACGDGSCGAGEQCATCVDDCCPIGDLRIWLRADSLSLNTLDPVATWPNLGSLGGNAVATNAAVAPAWLSASIGGRAAVRFDGVNDRLNLPGNPFLSAHLPYTVVAVLRTNDPSGHIVGLGSSGAGFLDSYGSGLTVSTGKATAKANSSSSGLLARSAQVLSDGQTHIVAVAVEPSRARVWLDGRLDGLLFGTANPFGYSLATVGASDGYSQGSSRDAFAGDIAEIRVYARALSDTELGELTLTLQDYYGLTGQVGDGCPLQGGNLIFRDDCGLCGGDGTACGAQQIPAIGRTLWLRSHDLSAWSNGSEVSVWLDHTSANRYAVQQNASLRPVVVHGGAGGLPEVYFDGLNDRLDLSANTFAASQVPLTVFAVVDPESNGHIVGTGSSSAGFLNSYGYGLIAASGQVRLKSLSNSTTQVAFTGATTGGGPALISAVVTSELLSARSSGVGSATTFLAPAAHAYSKSTLGSSDGSDSGASRDPFMGAISEILVYNRELSATERANVETYLAAKYQLALPQILGCDGVIGSGLLLDSCGICGGDGSACSAVPQSGAALWLRATDISAYDASSRPVTNWPNAISGGPTVQQSSATLRPAWISAALNNRPVIRFDGINDRLDLSTNLFASGTYPKTAFVVLQTMDASAHLIGTGSSSAGFITSYGGGMVIHGGVPHAKANNNSSGTFLAASSTVNNGNPTLITAIWQTGANQISIGQGAPSTSTSTVNAFGYSKSTLGSSDGSNTGQTQDPFAGDLAEVLVYNRVLTAGEITAVRNYLIAKFGL